MDVNIARAGFVVIFGTCFAVNALCQVWSAIMACSA